MHVQETRPYETFHLWIVFFTVEGLILGQTKALRQPIIDVHLQSESLTNLRDEATRLGSLSCRSGR